MTETLEELQAEYDSAHAEWRLALKNADRAGRKELRENPPAKTFLPRFEALASTGEGRALLWIAKNIGDTDLSKSAADQRRDEIFGQLVDQHVDQPWFGDALELMDAELRTDPLSVELLERVAAKTQAAPTRAHAQFLLGQRLFASDDADVAARGEQLLRAALESQPEATWSGDARRILAALDLRVGGSAPDFTGKTIDGHEFQLSDYRGKVVLLDFYGFW